MKLLLPLPPTFNTYWRYVGRKVLISAKGREYKQDCATAAMAQRAKKLEGDVFVRGTVFMARYGCDLDNRIKPLLDALQGVCYADDVQVARIDLIREVDHSRPRVELTIMET